MEEVIIVVGYGPTTVSAIAFSTVNGRAVCSAKKSVKCTPSQFGFHEINPQLLWEATCACMANVISLIGKGAKIHAIGFSFAGENLFLLDKKFEPLANAALYTDRRAVRANIQSVKHSFSDANFISRSFIPSQILHLRESQNELFRATAYFVSLQQYILTRLGLPPVWDRTMASCQRFFDSYSDTWDKDYISLMGLNEKKLGSEFLYSYEVVDKIDHFGNFSLDEPVPVIVGGHDADIGLLGLGITNESQDMIGEVSFSYLHVGYYSRKDALGEFRVGTHPGPFDNSAVTMKAYPHYCNAVNWFMDEIVGSQDVDVFHDMWTKCDFSGTSNRIKVSPRFFTSNGCFANLSLHTTKYDMFQSLMEALSFEARNLMEQALETKQGECTCLYVGGETAQDEHWMQLKADISGMTVKRMITNEAFAGGSAVLAGYGVSLYPSLEEAIKTFISVKDTFWPDSSNHIRYDRLYREYISSRSDE